MKATLTKPLKKNIKVITGTILQETFDRITLVIIDSNGSSRIKKFKKDDYSIIRFD